MDLHIDKKIAGLMIVCLLIGGIIGGAIGFAAGCEEGHGDRGEYMNKRENAQFDNQANGEADGFFGGVQNKENQKMINGSQTAPINPTSPTPTSAQ